MNLQEMRDYVRAQLDVDEEEYPNSLLDSYFSEGFARTIALENFWPWYEHRWTVVKPDGDTVLAIPSDCDPAGIVSVFNSTSRFRLTQISEDLAEDMLSVNTVALNGATYYSLWGGVLQLWPQVEDTESTFVIRGQRYPTAFGGDAGFVPDCDPRLHILICHYAIGLMYANQEDEVMEQVYMKRWQSGYAAARHAIMNPRHNRPLVLSGGIGTALRPVPGPNWNLP